VLRYNHMTPYCGGHPSANNQRKTDHPRENPSRSRKAGPPVGHEAESHDYEIRHRDRLGSDQCLVPAAVCPITSVEAAHSEDGQADRRNSREGLQVCIRQEGELPMGTGMINSSIRAEYVRNELSPQRNLLPAVRRAGNRGRREETWMSSLGLTGKAPSSVQAVAHRRWGVDAR
jgi:hypothetical protein